MRPYGFIFDGLVSPLLDGIPRDQPGDSLVVTSQQRYKRVVRFAKAEILQEIARNFLENGQWLSDQTK